MVFSKTKQIFPELQTDCIYSFPPVMLFLTNMLLPPHFIQKKKKKSPAVYHKNLTVTYANTLLTGNCNLDFYTIILTFTLVKMYSS